jgi:hypothetical protein
VVIDVVAAFIPHYWLPIRGEITAAITMPGGRRIPNHRRSGACTSSTSSRAGDVRPRFG